jgi:hypothetical protein
MHEPVAAYRHDQRGNLVDSHGKRAKTVVAQLVGPWLLGDPTLGHPAYKRDLDDNVVGAKPLDLDPIQRHGVELLADHRCYDEDHPETHRYGELVFLERRDDGAVWGVFSCRPGFNLAQLEMNYAGPVYASIQATGLLRSAPIGADLLGHSKIEHVALTPRPAMSMLSPAREALGAPDEGAGAPHTFTDYEKALLDRAVTASMKASVSQRSRSGSAALPILLEPYPAWRTPKPQPASPVAADDDDIVGWRNGKAIRTGDAARHPAATPVGMRNGVPTIRRTFPNRLTLR